MLDKLNNSNYLYNQQNRIGQIPVNSLSFGMDKTQPVNPPEHTQLQDTFKSFLEIPQPTEDQTKINKAKRKTVLAALSPIVPFRRVSSLPDNIEDGNYARAAALAGLMIINLPEDARDLKDGLKQISSKILPKSAKGWIEKRFPNVFKNYINYAPSYNYKEYQPAFSFIRGTFLEPVVNKMGKIGTKLHEWDKPIFSTKVGEKIAKFLKLEVEDYTKTGRTVPKVIKELNGNINIKDAPVVAFKLKGKLLSKVAGWGMLRTTTMGLAAMALLELPAVVKAFNKKEKLGDKIENTSKQTVKSAINVVSICSGIGVVGGLLARKGHAFSLLGMGIGSVLGAFVSNKTGKAIDKVWNTDK